MTTNSELTHSKLRIRIAVLTLFLAQGLCFASWASRLPDVKNHFSANDLAFFGYLLTLIPVGKFLAIPSVGFLLPRIGSKKTVLISILGFALSLFILGFTGNVWVLGIVMLLFGTFWNMTDISLNTQAIEVERIYGKAIIATFHAGWSLAACIGALIGYVMINIQIDTTIHFCAITAVACILIALNYPCLIEPKQKVEISENDTISDVVEKSTNNMILGIYNKKTKKFTLPESILVVLGFVWLLALIVENTMFEWSDIYFQSVINAPKSLQVGFLVFLVMMFVGRLLTNTAYRFWKKTTVLKVAGALIFFGFLISSMFIDFANTVHYKVAINSIGFMMIGLGISCIVPTIYSIVGDKATTPVGTALTIMSGISFVGPFLAPALVGFVSQEMGMKWAYLLVGLFGACILLIATFNKTLRK